MAQTLIELGLSDGENHSPISSPVMKRRTETSDSDSDSPPPRIKKKRATQTQVSSVYIPDPDQPSQLFGGERSIFHSNIYSTCKLQPAKLTQPTVQAEDEDDDEVEDLFKKKPKQKSNVKKTSTAASQHRTGSKSGNKSSRTRNKYQTSSSEDSSQDSDCRIDDYKPQVIMLEDEETDVDSEDGVPNNSVLSLSQTREPTPPPTPPDDQLPTRSKRMKRQVKTAFKKLEQAQKAHSVITQDLINEEEVSISEVTTPVKHNDKEISVKVKSRSGIQRFPMKQMESFVQLFGDMAKHENVAENQIAMFLNDRRINLYDTPMTLGLGIADIIECYIRKPEEVAADADNSLLDDQQNKIVLRVQTQDAKSRLNITIGLDEPLERLMREFCDRQGLIYNNVTFQFDGEDIFSHQTPQILELEDDFCIDVIKS